MTQEIAKEIPQHKVNLFKEKNNRFCLVIPVFNEGERIRSVLNKTKNYIELVDVIILDKGSTDGSLEESFLNSVGVRGVLTLAEEGALSSQLRMGYAFVLKEGYQGVLTIDGNDKDEVEAIPRFINKLEEGYDFVQASRYVEGGEGVNTPKVRDMAIRLVHAPVISFLSGFKYTDTTQGYRGYSAKMLGDDRLAIFRNVFNTYELLAYLSVKVPRLGYKVTEIGVKRVYPKGKKVPTKISFLKGNFKLLLILFLLAINYYDKR